MDGQGTCGVCHREEGVRHGCARAGCGSWLCEFCTALVVLDVKGDFLCHACETEGLQRAQERDMTPGEGHARNGAEAEQAGAQPVGGVKRTIKGETKGI